MRTVGTVLGTLQILIYLMFIAMLGGAYSEGKFHSIDEEVEGLGSLNKLLKITQVISSRSGT